MKIFVCYRVIKCSSYSQHADMGKTRALRHVYLVRHGQYHTRTRSEDQKQLTELGLYFEGKEFLSNGICR